MIFKQPLFRKRYRKDELKKNDDLYRVGFIEDEVSKLYKELIKLVGKSVDDTTIDLIEIAKRICIKLSEIKDKYNLDDGSMEIYTREVKSISDSKWFKELIANLKSIAAKSIEIENKEREQKIYKRLMHLYFYTENPTLAVDYATKRISALSVLMKEEDEIEHLFKIIDNTVKFAYEVINEFSNRNIITTEEKIELLRTLWRELKASEIKGGFASTISKKLEELENKYFYHFEDNTEHHLF